MRILFSGTPAYGHILPMLPLARAAVDAGHQVAVLTAQELAPVIHPVPVVAAGPTFAELLTENARRHPLGMGSTSGAAIGPAEAAEFFADTRVDVTFAEAKALAASFAPDLVVAETADYVGPLVADALGVPWARHAFGVELPLPFVAEMDTVAARGYAENRVVSSERAAYLDPCADLLQRDGWLPPADRITIRPEPFAAHHSTWTMPAFADQHRGPVVLVTFGTVVHDDALMAAVLTSLETAGVRALVTAGPGMSIALPGSTRNWAVGVGFVPLAELLGVVDAVVSVGGAGTVLSSLSASRPLVVVPVLPDQHWNGERAAATGSAIVVTKPADVAAAVTTVLTDTSYRDAAAETAARIAEMNSPRTALAVLIDAVTESSRNDLTRSICSAVVPSPR